MSVTTEKAETPPRVYKMVKSGAPKIIKTVRGQSNSEGETLVPLNDMVKTNTLEITQKIETSFAAFDQVYSNIYKKYVHTANDLFGYWYEFEKEFLGRFGMNKTALEAFATYWTSIADGLGYQIDFVTNFTRSYAWFRLASIDAFANTTQMMIGNYARTWTQLYPNKEELS